jgi:hypothetical protein
MNEILIKPAFQTKAYKLNDVAFVRDRFQQFKYLTCGAYPLDMYESNGDLIMVFSKAETRDLYKKWRNHEL